MTDKQINSKISFWNCLYNKITLKNELSTKKYSENIKIEDNNISFNLYVNASMPMEDLCKMLKINDIVVMSEVNITWDKNNYSCTILTHKDDWSGNNFPYKEFQNIDSKAIGKKWVTISKLSCEYSESSSPFYNLFKSYISENRLPFFEQESKNLENDITKEKFIDLIKSIEKK